MALHDRYIGESVGITDAATPSENPQVRASQALAQVEYDLSPQASVSQALAQVEYDLTPQINVSQALLQVEYTVITSRPTADDVGVTDALDVTQEFGGTDWTAEIAEQVGLTDDSQSVRSSRRSIGDDVGTTDAVEPTIIPPVQRIIGDNIGLTDDVQPLEGTGYSRQIAEDVGVSDYSESLRATRRTIAESIGLSDEESRLAEFFRTLAENLGITDAQFRPPVDYVRKFVSTIFTSDVLHIELIQDLVRTVADTVGVSDSAVWTFIETIVVESSIGLTDEITYLQGYTTTNEAADDVGITDSVSALRATRRFPASNVGVSDVAQRGAYTHGRNISDTVWAWDRRPRVVHKGAIIIADTVGVKSPILPRGLVKSVTVAEAVGISDSGPGGLTEGSGNVGGNVGVEGPTLPGGNPFGGTTIRGAMELLK